MSAGVESALRGPNAYDLARKVLEDMERRHIWPTALNFELWLHLVADPDGALAQEIGAPAVDAASRSPTWSPNELAAHLPAQGASARPDPRRRRQLSEELATVSRAIKTAQRTSADYGAHAGRRHRNSARRWGPAS